ncbi:MAG: molybdenum cofactor guanylyltransferase [Solirubrobacteraceae bacterium]
MTDPQNGPVGVVLAGGGGRRIGGDKATAMLAGRPLISYPLAVLGAVLAEVVVVAKAATLLPPLDGVEVWIEPQRPQHPVIGIVEALLRADGRPVLVCACDMPLLDAATVTTLATSDPRGAPAVIATGADGLQPLLGCYFADALEPLAAAADAAHAPLREIVARLHPRLLEVSAEALFNVNSPEDLASAEAALASRS